MKWHKRHNTLDKLFSPSEAWIVRRWTRCPWRINAWTAAGSAPRATRGRCRLWAVFVVCWMSCVRLVFLSHRFMFVLLFPCEHVNSFFTSQVKVKVSVNIGESPVLLKSNSVIQSVFSVSSPLFWQAAESLNGRVSRRFCCDTGGLLFEQLLLLGAKFAGLQQAGPSRWIESSISSPFGNERSDIRIAISVLHAETNPIFWDSRTNSSRKMMENVPDTSRYIKIHHTESYIIPYVIMTRHNDTSELETGALLSHRARPVCLWHLGLQRLEILYETSRVVKKFHIIS